MAARICLNMIVKNEAARIVRCLASLHALVDCAVIVDTGSTDATMAIVQEYATRVRLPALVVADAFTTWDDTRNRAMDRALNSGFAFDYFLFVDADMEAFGSLDDEALTAPAYSILQKHNTLSWRNFRLVRRDAKPRYVGVTHEYMSVEGPIVPLDSLWFYDHADGENRPGKFERDISLLSEALLREPDNARYWYYLGQSYRDARNDALAIEAFQKRIALGGWDEETFYTMLELARAERRIA